MENTEGLTAEQIAEIDALKAQLTASEEAKTELEEKNKNLGDKIYGLKKEKKADTPEPWFWKEDMLNVLREEKFFE